MELEEEDRLAAREGHVDGGGGCDGGAGNGYAGRMGEGVSNIGGSSRGEIGEEGDEGVMGDMQPGRPSLWTAGRLRAEIGE